MSCPQASEDVGATRGPIRESTERDDHQRFQRYLGTTLFAFFGGALFDQVMMPEVAAGVEWTGRIRRSPIARALRSAAANQLVLVGDDAARKAESDWLVQAHRDVKGLGFNGVRFSALNPESWNWIMMSTIMALQNAYTPITGEQLSDDQRQSFYEFVVGKFEYLQLPGKNSRLPENYTDLLAYYDELIRRKGETNVAVQGAVAGVRSAPMPASLPSAVKPAWIPLARLAGHVVGVCSFGIMHPTARQLTGFRWSRLHDFEFRVIGMLLPIAYRHLPRRLTMSPLSFRRWRYDQAVASCRSMRLESFAPDPH